MIDFLKEQRIYHLLSLVILEALMPIAAEMAMKSHIRNETKEARVIILLMRRS